MIKLNYKKGFLLHHGCTAPNIQLEFREYLANIIVSLHENEAWYSQSWSKYSKKYPNSRGMSDVVTVVK